MGTCTDLANATADVAPLSSTDECVDCVALGRRDWVHLRLCLTCGHVGCCDSSPLRHASEHFTQTGHPVMRSLEPGEDWRWCFTHQLLG